MLSIKKIELEDVDQVYDQIYQLAMFDGEMSPDFVLTKQKLIDDLFGDRADWHGLVVKNQQKVVASCLYCFANTNRTFNPTSNLFLDILFIDADYRNQGIGKMLMSELKKIAQSHNIKRIEFWCMKSHVASNQFYEKLGAEKVDLLNVYNFVV